MQSRGVTDLPYWPSQNMYVYKEVWVHPSSRWLWLMADLVDVAKPAAPRLDLHVERSVGRDGDITIRMTATGVGRHTFAVRAENLIVGDAAKTATLKAGRPLMIEWKARVASPNSLWAAVIIPDNDATRAR
jgi:hypothetical protein